jgi:hypothetical protein
MPGRVNLMVLPRISECCLMISHENNIVRLDKKPYSGEMPELDYGVSRQFIRSFRTEVPPPRENTYVLNLREASAGRDYVMLRTNYTEMRSLFALRRWIPEIPEGAPERQLILDNIMPVGGQLVTESSDGCIMVEKRGQIEVPGKYHVAPAGCCETRDWRVMPHPLRSIRGEAWEEMAIMAGVDYGKVDLLGIARDQTDGFAPTMTFHTKARTTWKRLKDEADALAPEPEHQRRSRVKVDEEAMASFMVRHADSMVGAGLGGLLIYGSHAFEDGRAWLDETVIRLKRKGWDIRLCERLPPPAD